VDSARSTVKSGTVFSASARSIKLRTLKSKLGLVKPPSHMFRGSRAIFQIRSALAF
jgi:hypothetical protein